MPDTLDKKDEELNKMVLDPITLGPMTDPIILEETDQTFERSPWKNGLRETQLAQTQIYH